eukprot:143759-Karenia_brevis.AAC.1
MGAGPLAEAIVVAHVPVWPVRVVVLVVALVVINLVVAVPPPSLDAALMGMASFSPWCHRRC